MTDRSPRSIALYGGSFNPPHLVHQMIVLALLETRDVDEVWLLPCFRHAFEKSLLPFEARARLCRRLIEPFGERADVCRIEAEMGGVSRTFDTLERLRSEHSGARFSLALGSDIREETASWYRWEELETSTPIHWFGRSGHAEREGDSLVFPDISSTDVRRRMQQGKSVSHLVPRAVLDECRRLEGEGIQWSNN